MHKSIDPIMTISSFCVRCWKFIFKRGLFPLKNSKETELLIFFFYSTCGSFLAITNGTTICRFLYILYYKLKCCSKVVLRALYCTRLLCCWVSSYHVKLIIQYKLDIILKDVLKLIYCVFTVSIIIGKKQFYCNGLDV